MSNGFWRNVAYKGKISSKLTTKIKVNFYPTLLIDAFALQRFTSKIVCLSNTRVKFVRLLKS